MKDKGETFLSHLTTNPEEPFSDGDVIRFKIRRYQFATIRSEGLWYATGHGSLFPNQGLAYPVLIRRLIDKEAREVQWTDQWKDVK